MFGGDSRNGGSVGVRIRTDRDHLAETIELVAEILQHPTFPADQFEIVKKENLAGIERQLSQPTALGFNSIMRRLSPWPSDDVRYRPTFPEMIERVKAVQLDTLKQIHGKFLGASYAQLTVVGDFDENQIREVTERLLGSWKSPKPFQRIVQKFRGDVKGSDDVIETPDKKMGMVACALNIELRDDDPDYPAMHLTHYVFGASAKSRLLNRLRHKEGLSYGAGAMFSAHSQDRDGMLAGYAICASENAHKAYDSLLDEFGILLREGIGGTELAEAKKSFALKVKTQLANDSAVVGMINNGLYLGRTMDYYKDLYEKIDQLTSSQIQSALKKHLNLQRLVKVKAGDLQASATGDGGS